MDMLVTKTEITGTDGAIKVIGGSMNDKLFAHLAPSQGWASYRIIQVVEHYVMSNSDEELKDYCESHDRVAKAMSY